nr:MAG TPA: protein of unknown function DUF1868 [Caudoviricetes sp.]
MKNYRERINVSIFFGNNLIVSVDGDRIKFDEDGDVFLYSGNVIVSHFLAGVWDKAKLFDKRTAERAGEVVNYFNYWVEF